MITYFYKILYKNKDVVYVGVTTTTVQHRFQQHIKSKMLNPDVYSVIEFDRLEHGNISSIEDYNRERLKVVFLEQKYIKEEKENGSNLLNISIGGEWGSQILNKLQKKNFLKKYGSYDGFKEYNKWMLKIKIWLNHWIEVKTRNQSLIWLRHWVEHRSESKLKIWLYYWKSYKSQNKVFNWLRHWCYNVSINKTKCWLQSWILIKSTSKFKLWLKHWVEHKTENKLKKWLRHWCYNMSINKTKYWLINWLRTVTEYEIKTWLKHWVGHRSKKINKSI